MVWQTWEIHTRQGHEKIKVGNWGEKPNQRKARQSIHLAIAAKCFSIISGKQVNVSRRYKWAKTLNPKVDEEFVYGTGRCRSANPRLSDRTSLASNHRQHSAIHPGIPKMHHCKNGSSRVRLALVIEDFACGRGHQIPQASASIFVRHLGRVENQRELITPAAR